MQAAGPNARADAAGHGSVADSGTEGFLKTLASYRRMTHRALLERIPEGGPPHLYDLAASYPNRNGKGLRAALCLATCGALGGRTQRAVNQSVAIELFHNAFLIHDDVQDGSEQRRGAPALFREHGVPIAVNVGNATNLLGLRRLMENRQILGPQLSWQLAEETEAMMRHTLEGQAIELAWIRDNASGLEARDYLHMCLKKTSWYSFIYPMRVGALIAQGRPLSPDRFCRFGWYMGAAFQIQDDILNLAGAYKKYGKEIGGDLWEGKRTLMMIELQNRCSGPDSIRLRRFLAKTRSERTGGEVEWVQDLMQRYDVLGKARRIARQLAGAALLEGLVAFRGVADSQEKQFILGMVLFVVNRDR
jgi:geranylgeranyl diphosphate synthase, type II